MSITIDAPLEWVESVGSLRLPPEADQRLQELMDRNNEGCWQILNAQTWKHWSSSVNVFVWCEPKRSTCWGANLNDLNHERRIKIRQAEALFNLFPPSDADQPDQHGSDCVFSCHSFHIGCPFSRSPAARARSTISCWLKNSAPASWRSRDARLRAPAISGRSRTVIGMRPTG